MRRVALSCVVFVAVLAQGVVMFAQSAAGSKERISWAIAVHGGSGSSAGPAPGEVLTPREQALRSNLEMGAKMLADGANAIDVCEKVVRAFEDSGQFNAGKGAVATADGKHSLDASLMDGSNLKFGAAAGLRTVKNPVVLARLVMDKTKHVMLIRDGAEAFAEKNGL